MTYDYIMIGAGLTSAVLARLLAEDGKRCLLLERRDHIAGNIYDRIDEHGIKIHQYGPHIFHTNNKEVWDFLSRFTEWNVYFHHVRAHVNGKNVPIPFNFNSMNELFPRFLSESLQRKLYDKYGTPAKVPILELLQTEDEDLKFLSDYIYENIFLNYTMKQWGFSPDEINPEVTKRVPVNVSRDDRYFDDKYQGHPSESYTSMVGNMLNHDNIEVRLNSDMKDLVSIDMESKEVSFEGSVYDGTLVYTGMIDEFFNCCYGDLSYRTLRFDFYHDDQREFVQASASVNYPNNFDFTRITEFKHLTGQVAKGTTYIKEYPDAYRKGENEAYYPMFTEESRSNYSRYKELADTYQNIIFAGRLAEYKYFDMDDACENAMKIFNDIKSADDAGR